MEHDIISVIMSTYNPNIIMLEKSINSILNQTYRNIEFVICDDGSCKEKENEIAKSCARDNRIKLIRNSTNIGLAASLNRCIEQTKGKYIARQDDDDYSLQNRIEIEKEFLDKNIEYGFVGCSIDLFDESGVWAHCSSIKKPNKEDFLKRSPFSHPTIMVRKETYELVNGYRVSWETKRAQDYDLFMRMYAKGVKGYNIQERLYQYYQTINSYKKVKYYHRIGEVMIRFRGFLQLKILFPKGVPYLFKPLLSGFINPKLRRTISEKRQNTKK